jgi:hypothetical protein
MHSTHTLAHGPNTLTHQKSLLPAANSDEIHCTLQYTYIKKYKPSLLPAFSQAGSTLHTAAT